MGQFKYTLIIISLFGSPFFIDRTYAATCEYSLSINFVNLLEPTYTPQTSAIVSQYKITFEELNAYLSNYRQIVRKIFPEEIRNLESALFLLPHFLVESKVALIDRPGVFRLGDNLNRENGQISNFYKLQSWMFHIASRKGG